MRNFFYNKFPKYIIYKIFLHQAENYNPKTWRERLNQIFNIYLIVTAFWFYMLLNMNVCFAFYLLQLYQIYNSNDISPHEKHFWILNECFTEWWSRFLSLGKTEFAEAILFIKPNFIKVFIKCKKFRTVMHSRLTHWNFTGLEITLIMGGFMRCHSCFHKWLIFFEMKVFIE